MRLARALQERGHRVLIASSGGQLVPELEAYGIEHREVDFTGWRTLSGMLALRRLLEREQVDLVNAHNWRAGMVASLACGLAGVPYVLTVHGSRRPVHRHGVFYWSKRVVVVSEASKRNLVSGFGLPDERVLRSIVGVECDRFHPGPAGAALEAELGLRPGAPRVVHVSRFSHSKAPVALALIRAMETLSQQCPGLELVLVGQGPEEAAVAREAEAMNQRLGRRGLRPGRALRYPAGAPSRGCCGGHRQRRPGGDGLRQALGGSGKVRLRRPRHTREPATGGGYLLRGSCRRRGDHAGGALPRSRGPARQQQRTPRGWGASGDRPRSRSTACHDSAKRSRASTDRRSASAARSGASWFSTSTRSAT